MTKYNVMINWIQTIERSLEIEVFAKDESEAEVKATKKAEAAAAKDCVKHLTDWDETNTNDEFEYEVSE